MNLKRPMVIKIKIDHEAAVLNFSAVSDGPQTVEDYLRQAFGVQRHAFNWGLNRWNEMYEAYVHDQSFGPTNLPKPNAIAIKKEYTALKKTEFPWAYHVTKCAPQTGFDNLDQAFKNWFKSLSGERVGPAMGAPTFKKKGVYESFKLISDHCKFQVIEEWVPKWKAPVKRILRASKDATSQHLCGPQPHVLKKKAYLNLPNFGYVRLRETPYQMLQSEASSFRLLSAIFSEEADGFYVSLSFVPASAKTLQNASEAVLVAEPDLELVAATVTADVNTDSRLQQPEASGWIGYGAKTGLDAGLRQTIHLSKPVPVDFLKQHGIFEEWMDFSSNSLTQLQLQAESVPIQAVKGLLIPKALLDNYKKLRYLDKAVARKKNKANPLVNLTKTEAKLLILWRNILMLQTFGLTSNAETLKLLNDWIEPTLKASTFSRLVAKIRDVPRSHALIDALQQRKELYLHIRRVREDFVHKVSNALVQYFSFIGIETLNLKGMANKGFGLGKSVASACIGKLFQCLGYKVERTGTLLQKIGKWFPSSKKCSTKGCSYINDKLTLKDKTWICPECGVEHDRDDNASVNIEVEALRLAGSA